jgi:hypothetical protein
MLKWSLDGKIGWFEGFEALKAKPKRLISVMTSKHYLYK